MTLLQEFGTSFPTSILLMVALFLYIVPFLAVLATALSPRWLFYPFPAVITFFLPGLILARTIVKRLQTSGTRRVEVVEQAVSDSIWLGYGGIAYIVIFWMISFAANSISSSLPVR